MPRTSSGRLPRPEDRVPLGRTGLEVSPFCLGMAARPEVPAAFEAGINFFFVSADMHWPRYQPLREGVAALLEAVPRDRIAVAAVSYLTQPEFCSLPFIEVLDAIPGLGHLDVLVMGGAYGGELEQRAAVYRDNLAGGLAGARGLGISFHDRAAARATILADAIDVAFVRYNPLHAGAREDLFPGLAAGERACLVYNFNSTRGHQLTGSLPPPEADGMWIPRVADYYRFALTRPEVDGILCAFSRPQEIAELVAALDDGPLSADEEDFMIALVAEIEREVEALAGRAV
jgi:hypothetical protein